MKLNAFEGARRVILILSVVATVATGIAATLYSPNVSMRYSTISPSEPLERTESDCPSDAAKHFFTTKTTAGHPVWISLCLLAMDFGADKRMVAYRLDAKGLLWGRDAYSSEVTAYAAELESRFHLSKEDEKITYEKSSKDYWENMLASLKYLVIGLTSLWLFSWMIGWIIRGFLSIPTGKDKGPH